MPLRVTVAVLLFLAGCGPSATTGGASCADGGNCPCFNGAACRPSLTCSLDLDWRILDCTCAADTTFSCAYKTKPSGACESTLYCNKGMTSCQAETMTCHRDCRCEYTKTPAQGVWLCQDNCDAAKECPKTQPSGACTLAASVQCRYWSATDSDVVCTCGVPDGGTGSWSCSG